MEPLHKSQIIIHILDRSTSNFDEDWGRPKGQIPTTTVTMYGQIKYKKENYRTNREQGDLPESDGYIWLRKPLTAALERGDIIYSVEGSVINAEIVEVKDGAIYQHPRAIRVSFAMVQDG